MNKALNTMRALAQVLTYPPTLGMLLIFMLMPAIFISIAGSATDNTRTQARDHIRENRESIGQLVASTAQDQENINIDPGQEPHIRQNHAPRRDDQPGAPPVEYHINQDTVGHIFGGGLTTMINHLEYQTDPPSGRYLTVEYLTTYRVLDGTLRYLIPGENYHLEDAFLDGASIKVLEHRNPLRAETVTQREPVRIALAEMGE